MRTTVRLDDALGKAAKVRAAEQGITLTQLIDESLRERLARRAEARGPRKLELPVYGSGGVRSGVELSDNRALRDLIDDGLPAAGDDPSARHAA
jgi:hypothetical protein